MTLLMLSLPSALAALTSPSLLPGDAAIGPAAGDQENPVLVAGDGEYLLVWEDARATLAGTLGNNGSTTSPDLYAIRLDANGVPLDTVPFPVASGPWLETAPRAAYSDGVWLVAYEADAATTFYFSQGVYSKRIEAATGEVLDVDPILLVNDDSQDEWLHDVAGNGTDFAVLWQAAESAVYVLDGATVDATGTASAPVRIYTPAYNLYAPWNAKLVWNTDRYLVGWDAWGASSTSDIQAMLVDASLDPLTSVFAVASDATSDVSVAVGAGDGGFYMAWQDNGVGGYWTEIQGTPVTLDGDLAIEEGTNLSEELFPAYSWSEVAWTGSNWAVSWTEAGAFTTLVETDGTPIDIVDVSGTDGTISSATNADGVDAAITAWAAATSRDGWGFGYDVEATSVSSAGSVATPVLASRGAPAQTHPEIAGDAGGYMLVTQSQTGTRSSIVAWTLDRRGVPSSARPITLATGTGEIQDPAVAWNGSVYLVVWEEYNTGRTSSQIWGKRVSRTGRVLDGSPIAIMAGNDPAVAASGTDFLVVDSIEIRHEEREIDGVRVANDGSLLDTTPFIFGTNFATEPDVAGTSSGWLVSWTRAPSHDSPYHTARVASLSTAGVKTAQEDVRPGGVTAVQVDVSVASDGTNGLVTWSDDGDVAGRFVDSSGTPTGSTTGIAINTQANDQFETNVAWNGVTYQVAWTDWRIHPTIEPGEGDVYTTGVTTAGVVIHKRGMILSADPEVPEGNTALAGANGTTVFGWAKLHDEAPYAAFRVETASLTGLR
jgi:large repetitive protein